MSEYEITITQDAMGINTDASYSDHSVRDISEMSSSHTGMKRSPVWKLMSEIPGDPYHSKCDLCGKIVSRGKPDGSSRTTSNMKAHLVGEHKRDYDKADEESKRQKEEVARNSTASPSVATVDLTLGSSSHVQHQQTKTR